MVRLVALGALAETWVCGRSVVDVETKELPCLGPVALRGVVLLATTRDFFAVYCVVVVGAYKILCAYSTTVFMNTCRGSFESFRVRSVIACKLTVLF